MKKTFKFVLIGFISLILVTGIALIIFVATFDIKRYKPAIINAARDAVDREVTLDDIALKISFRQGISLHCAGVTVAEDPVFGNTPFLTAGQADLGVSLGDLILKRQIRITKLAVKDPQINFIRIKEGKLNVQTLGARVDKKPEKQSIQVSKSPASAPVFPAVFINSMLIEGMKIRYIDRSEESALDLECRDIRISVDNFSLTRPFYLSLSAAFASGTPDIFFEGAGEFNAAAGSFLLKDSTLTVDLSVLSVEELRNSIAALKSASLPEQLKGKVKIDLQELHAGSGGLMSLKAKGTLSEGLLKIKEIPVPMGSIQSGFDLTESTLVLSDASCTVGTGTLAVSGQVKDYLKNRDFQFKTKFDKLDLSQCLDQSAYSVKVRGLVSGTVEGGATGGETQSSPPALKAAGNIEVKEGRLVDMNVLKMVLDKIPVISNLTSLLEAGLPAEFREKLVQKDTAVPSLKLSASLADGTITIQPVSLEADGFSFKGEGSIGADRQYSLKGSFVIEPEMASRMAESVSEIKFLMDETLRIRFPLKVTGKGGSVSFAPDVQGIGVSAIKNTVTNELQKVFDKVFKPAEEQPKQTVP